MKRFAGAPIARALVRCVPQAQPGLSGIGVHPYCRLIVLAGLLTRIYPWVTARRSDTTNQSDDAATASEEPPPPPRGRTSLGLPLILVGSVIALVLVALISQWFGSTESDNESGLVTRPGLEQDDRGPVEDDEWSIALNDQGDGIHTVVMIKTFTPLRDTDIKDLGGRLIWEETEIELCSIDIRSVGDGSIQIGDIFHTTEACSPDAEMQEAFDEFGPPETAFVYVRADGLDDEYCAPLALD